MNRDELFHKNLMLSHEFDLYVLENPEILEQIPDNSEIALLPEDDPELAKINLEMAREKSETDRTVIFVHLGKLKPLTSRINQFKMETSEATSN